MFAPPPSPTSWRRHLVAATGALCAVVGTGLGLARCTHPAEQAQAIPEVPLPTLYVPVTMSPTPPAPKPAGRGGGGPAPTPKARKAPTAPPPEATAAPRDTQSLLESVDVNALGRSSREEGPAAGGPGPSGPGSGVGQPGTGSGAGGSGVQDLEPLYTPSPSFPRAARELGLEALCTVTFRVNRHGRTTEVDIEGCDTAFHAAIKNAALRWRFEPRRVDGKRVPASTTKRIRFVIR